MVGGPCSLVPFHFCPMFACSRSFSLFVPYNISAYHIPPTISSPTPSKNIHEAENIKSRVLRVTLNSFLNLQVNHHNTQTHQNASSSLLVLIFSMWYLILLEIPLHVPSLFDNDRVYLIDDCRLIMYKLILSHFNDFVIYEAFRQRTTYSLSASSAKVKGLNISAS